MSSDIILADLSPKDDLTVDDSFFRVYKDSLDNAFGNPQIRNLALSGSLGSGKSSIIRSFDKIRNKKKQFLYVSLIDFSRAITDVEERTYDQKQLEYSLLNQILSYCTSSDLPEGSIRGIPEKFKFLDFTAGYITLLCLSIFVLIFHEQFGALAAMFGIPAYLRSNIHLLLYLFVMIVFGGCVYRILSRCLPFLQVSKLLLKSDVAEAEINLGKDRTTLDTHKFELAYILERIGKKHDYTVVFEDLERLDSATAIDIMVKLRELNTLTNNHLQIQAQTNFQPIRFIYAISDSTMPVENRTKFFDCIIPVIPVSHPLNSKEQLRNILKELSLGSEWEDQLCEALSEAFVDYRTLLSLRNEFRVLQALYRANRSAESAQCVTGTGCASDSRSDHFLLAITAYRLLLPEWFELTLSPQGDGILPDFSSTDAEQFFKEINRAKAYDAVRKLFQNGLLGKASMRLIIGERALSEQWLNLIRVTIDTDTFDRDEEPRIRTLIETLRSILPDVMIDPVQAPYADFRKTMTERLFTLNAEKDMTQFSLAADSLAAVSRKDASEDWNWLPHDPIDPPVNFHGFLRNYFCWLENLSRDPEWKDCPNTTNCLRNLCQRFPENWKTVYEYTRGLADRSGNQELTERTRTADLLKGIRSAFPEDQKIAIEYAKSLVNLSSVQELTDRTETIEFLRQLRNKFPENQKIVLEYAKGLFNLSCYQSLLERTKTISQLKHYQNVFPNNEEIALECAKGLLSLSGKQLLPDRTKTIALMKDLWNAFPKNQEIALRYAKGLFTLSFLQELPDRVSTIPLMKDLSDAFPENQEIALQYAEGMLKLTLVQEKSHIPDTVAELVVFLRKHPGIIPEFKVFLNVHLILYPHLREQYSPLLDL